MGQRLREIAGLAAGTEIELFGQQSEIVGDRDHAIEQRLRLCDLARQHIGVGEPQLQARNAPSIGCVSSETSRGSCRSTKPSGIMCFSIAAMVSPNARIRRRQETNRRQQQDAGIEQLRAIGTRQSC